MYLSRAGDHKGDLTGGRERDHGEWKGMKRKHDASMAVTGVSRVLILGRSFGGCRCRIGELHEQAFRVTSFLWGFFFSSNKRIESIGWSALPLPLWIEPGAVR